MHEYWLQKYIKEHCRQLGFAQLHGPYKTGADFKGIYAGNPVKVEAEWDYSDYISHKHTLKFADILVVAAPGPVPPALKEKLPPVIINVDRTQVEEWAQPRSIQKDRDDYHAYPWRRLSRNLLYLYAHYRKQTHQKTDFTGSRFALSIYKSQKPEGFQFGNFGKEESFEGRPEDKADWDYWLNLSHAVAENFRLKPTLLHPTWIDRLAIYVNHTGRITDSEFMRFRDVAKFIDEVMVEDNKNTA